MGYLASSAAPRLAAALGPGLHRSIFDQSPTLHLGKDVVAPPACWVMRCLTGKVDERGGLRAESSWLLSSL